MLLRCPTSALFLSYPLDRAVASEGSATIFYIRELPQSTRAATVERMFAAVRKNEPARVEHEAVSEENRFGRGYRKKANDPRPFRAAQSSVATHASRSHRADTRV
jgi:hypothetical protein